MRFCLSCGIAIAPDRLPDGFGPITNREKDDSTITEPLRRPRCRINSRQQSRLSRGLAATTVRNFHMTGKLPNESMMSMDKNTISRGFRSKRQEQTLKNRLPPGQYVTTDFPVLSAGPTPQIKLEDWTFAIQLAARCSANGTGQSSKRSLRLRSRRIFTASPNGRNSIRLGKA